MKLRRQLLAIGCLLLVVGCFRATAADLEVEPVAELRPLRGARADVAALILGGRESGSLRAAGLAVTDCADAIGSADGTTRVNFWVELENASLLAATRGESELSSGEEPATSPTDSLRLELYAYAMTPSGGIAGSTSRWVRLPVRDLLQSSGVKLMSHMDLPPGAYRLRVLVREPVSQRFVLRFLEVAISEANDRSPALEPPLFEERVQNWLVVRDANGTRIRDSAMRRAGGDVATTQAALPVLSSGGEPTFALAGCHLGDAAFAARLLHSDARPLAALELTVSAATNVYMPSRVGRVRLPELDAGIYLLEVAAESGGDRSVARLPVFVPSGPIQGEPFPWTSVGGNSAAADDSPTLRLAEGGRPSQKVERIIVAYRGVLDRLAEGALADAARRLYDLEMSAVGASDKPRRALKRLTTAQNRVTNELVGKDVECLFPLLLLHLELHDLYVERGEPKGYLINGTRTRIRALAQFYATEAKSEMAPALAATSLVHMAAALERAQQFVGALTVLREALSLDTRNPEVLLDLAYQFERHGFQQEALDVLRHLLEVEPHSGEGRLRLALIQFRNGSEDDAAALLGRLTADSAPDWVLAVAYQELAAYLLRHDRAGEAVAVLEKAVRRLPSIQRLYVQLAYALDRSGERRRGREIADRIPADAGAASPRLLYRLPPRSEESRSRNNLVRHATARLPLLAQALAGSGSS
ncbi:MAG: hypothetical protein OEM62_09495 [Acidobacteriota bacterium]|nr:hypothetical protein [Acidobacteriota bacterium]